MPDNPNKAEYSWPGDIRIERYEAGEPPEHMNDAEYAKWCFDNKMPYWAIRKELVLREAEIPAPVLTTMSPDDAIIGEPSFTLYISGSGFLPGSVIVFAGYDEPTTLNADGTVSTGVNMDVWHGADVVPVSVRNGDAMSNVLDFTFTAAASDDPDDLEEEIEEAKADGDVKVRAKKAKK